MLNVQLTIVIPKSRDHMISSRNKKVDVLTIPTYHRMYPLDNLLCPYLLFNSSFNKFVLSTNYAQGILEYYESANMVTGDITCSCIKMPNLFFLSLNLGGLLTCSNRFRNALPRFPYKGRLTV